MKGICPTRADIIRILVHEGLRIDQLQGLPACPTWMDVRKELDHIALCRVIDLHDASELPHGCIGFAAHGQTLIFFEHSTDGKLQYFTDIARKNILDASAYENEKVTRFFIRIDQSIDASAEDGSIIGSPWLRRQLRKPVLELPLFSFVTTRNSMSALT